MSRPLELVPGIQRPAVAAALLAAFGAVDLELEPILGGASGARAYRVDVGDECYLLRLEGPRTPLRNPHQYACMRIAAEAGIAPPLVHADEEAGIAIMRFLAQRPLAEYPGGPAGLARAVGELARRLQATSGFPVLNDYFGIVGGMLEHARANVFAPGALDPYLDTFARIREAYRPDAGVSSHNDPNPMNVLYDGERLWLIDWETAYSNDPMTDIAIMANNFAPTPELVEALLAGWRGHAPDGRDRARLAVMRQVVRLYYAGLIFTIVGRPGPGPIADMAAPTPAQFQAEVGAGRLAIGSPEMMCTLGLMSLADFRAGLADPAFEAALAAVA